MPINKKVYLKNEAQTCSILVGDKKDKQSLRKCLKGKICHIKKCITELDDHEDSQISLDKDMEPCMKITNETLAKQCADKIHFEQRQTEIKLKNGKIKRCIALKCPEEHEFMQEFIRKEYADTKEKCLPCIGIEQKLGKAAMDKINIENECNKKFESIDQQSECAKSANDKIYTINQEIYDCREKHCSKKQKMGNGSMKSGGNRGMKRHSRKTLKKNKNALT